jgi:Leucine-rich repeat (LRR) protein
MKKISTLFLTLLFSFSMLANVSQSEKNALVKFYQSTNGKQWKVQWDLSSPVSTWYGVKVQDEKVIAVHLADNNLVGEIPTDIVNLVNLQELDLHRNQISGTIPSAIGKLKDMKVLNLSFNKLTGSIPSSVCELSNLKDLELYMNRFSGELPSKIGDLKQLEILSLYNNDIYGEIPTSLYTLKSLKILLLNSNKFSGKLNPLVATLSNLESISLFDNNFMGQVPFELEKLKNLKEMNISFNMFSGLVSKDLVQLDAMNMKMINEEGIAVLLKVAMDRNSAIVSED